MARKTYVCGRCKEALHFPRVLLISREHIAFECDCSPGEVITSDWTWDEEAMVRLIMPFRILLPYSAADTALVAQGYLDRVSNELRTAWDSIRNAHDFLDLCATFDTLGQHDADR